MADTLKPLRPHPHGLVRQIEDAQDFFQSLNKARQNPAPTRPLKASDLDESQKLIR